MKTRLLILLAACLAATGCSTLSTSKPKKAAQVTTTRLTLLPQRKPSPGRPVEVLAKLNQIAERRVLTNDDLTAVHGEPFHLLVVDETLTDYQHIHPQQTITPGIYTFSFTPKRSALYRAWADITPKATGKQEFAMTEIGEGRGGAIDKTVRSEADIGGYRFSLTFDKPPVAGGESVGTIRVLNYKEEPFTELEPLMGAYGHIVGFYDNFHTVVHTHPIGAGPVSPTDRGGPELVFHLEPSRSGFLKLFAQVRIKERDLYVPFGIMIGEASR